MKMGLDFTITTFLEGDLGPLHGGDHVLLLDLVVPVLELEGVVVHHRPLLVLAKNGVQVVVLGRPVGVIGQPRGNGVALLPEGDELVGQEVVGLLDGVDAPVAQHLDHLALEGPEEPLDPALGLRTPGEDHDDPQVLHRPLDLRLDLLRPLGALGPGDATGPGVDEEGRTIHVQGQRTAVEDDVAVDEVEVVQLGYFYCVVKLSRHFYCTLRLKSCWKSCREIIHFYCGLAG